MSEIDGEVFDFYLGLPGKGKTLSLNELNVLPALQAGLDVYTTYWVNWALPNWHYFKKIEEVYDKRNCVVVFDELGNVLDARSWASEDANIRNFFQLHRHYHVDIYGSTQHLSLVAKSALIVVDRFFDCTRAYDGWLIKTFWPNFPWVVVDVEELTLQELKLKDMPVFNSSYDNDDDLDYTGEVQEVDTKRYFYSKHKLLHRELDDFKSELIHSYCPMCKARQGVVIPKEKTYEYAYREYANEKNEKKYKYVKRADVCLGQCPKHKNVSLEIRESGMYDSHYELDIEEQEVIFKPFVKALKETPYRGSLSPRQIEQKRNLSQK